MFAAIPVTQRVFVLALCCVLWACASASPARTLTSIDPDSVSNDSAVDVTLHGSGFVQIPKVSLSSRERAGVEVLYQLRIGHVFTTDVVEKHTNTTLVFKLPSGLPVGTYDVVLSPRGASDLTLKQALTVTAPKKVSTHLSIEDAPGGAGTALDPLLAKSTGDQLTCYAVVRDDAGEFVMDAPASWDITGAVSAAYKDSASVSLTFTRAGDTTIHAQYMSLAPVTLVAHASGRQAQALRIEPNTAALTAGDPALKFEVHGEDEAGNDTLDVGELSYAVSAGALPDFDAATATLTPKHVSTGQLLVHSSYDLSAMSGRIEVTAGPLSQLAVSPVSLKLSADDQPVQFVVTGSDAFDNPVSELGNVTWSLVNNIGSGPIGALSDTGLFDPTTVGTAMVNATSSLGPGKNSATIEVVAGKLAGISISPQTWIGTIGDAAQQFNAMGADADGNAIATDIGTLTFSIASGSIASIDAQTGLFTPTATGQGNIAVSTSLGYSTSTQNVVVSPKGATLKVTAVRAPSFVWAGETGARVEVDVASTDPNEVAISGMALKLSSLFADQTSNFTVYADRANVDHIPAGATQTLIYYLDVSSSLGSLTLLTTNATGEAFAQFKQPFVFAGSVSTSTHLVVVGPKLSLNAPVAPADRVCAGGRVLFGADTSNLLSSSFEWRLPGATLAAGSSATDKAPSADYAAVGNYTYSVTATYLSYPTTLFGTPIYVGMAAGAAADTYPAGPVVFSAPSAGQAVALSSFPRSDLIALSGTLPLRQCNGSALDASGHRTLTLFSDRGLINASADTDPATPGVQVQLTTGGLFGSVPLVAPKNKTEGSTTLYAEYVEPNTGVVTAAGDTTFKLSADSQAPSLQWTIPSVDCASACLAPGDPLLFQFSEPMSLSSLSNIKVELLSGTSCAGSVSTNLTSGSTRSYETAGDLVYVTPPTRSGSYAVRVTLPASVTDTASAPNALPAATRCAVFGAVTAAADAATPQLAAVVPTKFTPDADADSDSVTFKASADAATSFLRLRITRAGKVVWARLSPVAQAGDYTFVWDGADDTGRILNDAVYGYAIEAVNRAGKASAALRGYVEIDSAVRMVSLRRPQ